MTLLLKFPLTRVRPMSLTAFTCLPNDSFATGSCSVFAPMDAIWIAINPDSNVALLMLPHLNVMLNEALDLPFNKNVGLSLEK